MRRDRHEGKRMEGGDAMTRQEMASAVDDQARMARYEGAELVAKELDAAAAELRKSCAGCKHFTFTTRSVCKWWDDYGVPDDGSGFCHEWSAK
jgi:hypothetical protein